MNSYKAVNNFGGSAMIQWCDTCCSYWSPNLQTFKGYCMFLFDRLSDHRFIKEVDALDDGRVCPRYERNKIYDSIESS